MAQSTSPRRTRSKQPPKSRDGKLDPRLVLHPVHLRILVAVQRRPLTTAQIAIELPTLPQATLYRHISKLVAGGALVVCDEQWVHGARERTYTVPPEGAYISREKLQRLPKGELINYFNQFLSLLADGFSRHVEASTKDRPDRDQVRFYVESLHVTENERAVLIEDIRALIAQAAQLPPSPERRRQTLAHISFPSS